MGYTERGMSESKKESFHGRDGLPLVYFEVGDGRPLVLIHGFTGGAEQSWLSNGHASLFASRGHRVVMPDLRGHGRSSRPHNTSAYPPDVLTDDGLALVESLGLTDYDLCGYSLGARVVLRMLVRGALPRRAVLGGQGLDVLSHETPRTGRYRHLLSNLGTFARDTREGEMESWIKDNGGDPIALLQVLDSFVDTPIELLSAVRIPVLIALGEEDRERASSSELAAGFPNGRHLALAGNHMTAVAEFVTAAAEFLDTPA